MKNIGTFKIRASYPNYFMVNLYAKRGRMIFEKEYEFEGNKPGTIIYSYENEDVKHELPPKWYDIYYMLSHDNQEEAKHFLSLLIEEEENKKNDANYQNSELESLRNELYEECCRYVNEHPLYDDNKVVTTLTEYNFSEEIISNKGHMLMELTKQCYAVPDFCILSTNAFSEENQEDLLRKAIGNLEIMTKSRLGDDKEPLVFALRSAMPQYIPGLMPTMLNIGVNRIAHQALKNKYGPNMGNRIYLNTLSNIYKMLSSDGKKLADAEQDTEKDTEKNAKQTPIEDLEKLICMYENGKRLLEDSFYQVLRLTQYVRDFYKKNQDLILTFMRGRQAYPSLILHKMVWTIGNDMSCPGVLYSRHSGTGVGRQIESYPDIFGEEIMTGNISSVDMQYLDRSEIRGKFSAVYHFDPLLINLEKRFKSPITIEFAIETIPEEKNFQVINKDNYKESLFAVLQLNKSEMTGIAAMISVIEMYKKHIIDKEHIINLIRPYHLQQIFSDRIDEKSFVQLQFFCNGVSVLPRTAKMARICFSPTSASDMRRQGFPVCLCKKRFTPEDTIILNEVDAIISMTPAAIHVVTACRGYGIPAFLNLQEHGVRLEGDKLVNKNGDEIEEYEWITVSSRRQSIYKGQAVFTPARFRTYIEGEGGGDIKMNLNSKERKINENLKKGNCRECETLKEPYQEYETLREAYQEYQNIITNSEVNYITDIDTLARIISYDLNKQPEAAMEVVNNWYNKNAELYLNQVLESRMGSHKEQSMAFDLLSIEKKCDFFKKVIYKCKQRNISGLQAGSFMLGRFISKPLPKTFWNQFYEEEIAFMLNEYVLYEKYLAVLQEVGETKLVKAHSQIMSEGLDNQEINNFDLYNFVPLMILPINWDNVIASAYRINSMQQNTLLLINTISKPIDKVFNCNQAWVKDRIDKLSNL